MRLKGFPEEIFRLRKQTPRDLKWVCLRRQYVRIAILNEFKKESMKYKKNYDENAV